MPATQNAQGTLEDIRIDRPDIEARIRTMFEDEGPAKRYQKARREVLAMIKGLEIELPEEGGEVKVVLGAYQFTIRSRSGGGFDVPEWTTNVVGKITAS